MNVLKGTSYIAMTLILRIDAPDTYFNFLELAHCDVQNVARSFKEQSI